MNLEQKVILFEPIVVKFQEFKDAIQKINDKKAHGIDGMPVNYLRNIGDQKSFKFFCDWTTGKLSDHENKILSIARVVFLSKTKKEIIKDHSEYRCLAIQPTFIRILEQIAFKRISRNKITKT